MQAGPLNAHALMKSTIAGAEVTQPPGAFDELDLRMMAGDGGGIDDDEIIHLPPDGDHLLAELVFGGSLIGMGNF